MNPAAMLYASPPIRKSTESMSANFDDSANYANSSQLNVTSTTVDTAVNDSEKQLNNSGMNNG
jgi:hypothetical protein